MFLIANHCLFRWVDDERSDLSLERKQSGTDGGELVIARRLQAGQLRQRQLRRYHSNR